MEKYKRKAGAIISRAEDEQIFLSLIALSALLMTAVTAIAGWGSISMDAGDRANIVRRSLYIYQTGNVFGTIDPPFRYLPWVAAYLLVGPENANPAGFATTVFFGLVLLPVAVATFAYRIANSKIAIYTITALFATTGLGLLTLPWQDNWHYITPLPFAFLTLILIDADIQNSSTARCVLVGLSVGFVGLQQLGYGFLMALVMVVAYILAREKRALLIALTSGSLCASYIPFYLMSGSRSRASIASQHLRLVPVENVIPQIVSFANDGLFILTCVIILLYLQGKWINESACLTATIITLVPIYLLSKLVLLPSWFPKLTMYILQFALCIALLVSIRDVIPDVNLTKSLATITALIFLSSGAILHQLYNIF